MLPMRCRKLRLASYSAASTLLHVFGGSAALACAEPLIAAACADLSAEATAPPVPPPARSEQPQPHKRQRGADAPSDAAASSAAAALPAPRRDVAMQLAAARALAALLHAGAAG